MGRLTRLPAMLLFRLGALSVCAALLVGVVLVVLALPLAGPTYGAPSSAGADAGALILSAPTNTPTKPTSTATPRPTATATPKPTGTATPRPTATATAAPTATSQPAPTATPQPAPTATAAPLPTATDPPVFTPTQVLVVITAPATAMPAGTATAGVPAAAPAAPGKPAAVPPWLAIGLAALFGALLLFSLITFVVARRLGRQGTIRRPLSISAFSQNTSQFSRLSQVPPVRRQPLTREQMLALRQQQEREAGISNQTTASLAAVRLVNGVPVTLPITEPETILPETTPANFSQTGKRPAVSLIVEGSSGKQQAVPKKREQD